MSTLRLGVNTLFYLPGEVGGSETYLRETLEALQRQPQPPDLVLFSNAENDRLLRAEFPRAEVVPTGVAATNRLARILAEQFQLPGLIRRARPDVLWSPGYTAPAWCACPQVVTVLDMQYKRFLLVFTWEFLAANVNVVWTVLFRARTSLNPNFVTYDVAGLRPFEILLLFHCISLTSGSTTV